MDIVTIDFETYYDREYSLSKITTEEYIRDPRFEVIGVGVKINDDPVDWCTGDDVVIRKFLHSLDYSRRAILAHNTWFDGAILSWHFGIRPALWLDTWSMARPHNRVNTGGSLAALAKHFGVGTKGDEVVHALGKRRADFSPQDIAAYGAYCRNDVDLTYKIFKILSRTIPAAEIMLIDKIIRMYTEPKLVLDKSLLARHLDEVQSRKADILESIGLGQPEEAKALLTSNERFADALRCWGVDPPMQTSKATGLLTYAFNKSNPQFMELLNHPDPVVAELVAARLGTRSTIEETRTTRLMHVADRGSLPVMLQYYGAHTGRLSGGDKINLQNLPRGGTLRKAIKAPPGHTLIAADSSQIEARMLAWIAGERDLLASFAEGKDVYCEFATRVYGRAISKADATERHVGKTCILGLGYGMGSERFRTTLSIGLGGMRVQMDEHEARSIVQLYRSTYWRIARFWDTCGSALQYIADGAQPFSLSDALPSLVTGHERIMLPNSLPITYPGLFSTAGERRPQWLYAGDNRVYRDLVKARQEQTDLPYARLTKLHGGKVTENIVQALARIVITTQMLSLAKRWPVVLQVHDENVLCVPDADVEEAVAHVRMVMSTPPHWAPDLPVACAVGVGKSYGECK